VSVLVSTEHTRKTAIAANPHIFIITYWMLGNTESSLESSY